MEFIVRQIIHDRQVIHHPSIYILEIEDEIEGMEAPSVAYTGEDSTVLTECESDSIGIMYEAQEE